MKLLKFAISKKIILLPTLILICSLCAFAQDGISETSDTIPIDDIKTSTITVQDERKFAVGLGVEWNMNSRESFAAGGILQVDFNLPNTYASTGLTVTYSNNFFGITVIEPVFTVRFYPFNNGYDGWFGQSDVGAYLVLEKEKLTSLFLMGFNVGYRLPLKSLKSIALSNFFVDMYARGGYPFVFGIGVIAGVNF